MEEKNQTRKIIQSSTNHQDYKVLQGISCSITTTQQVYPINHSPKHKIANLYCCRGRKKTHTQPPILWLHAVVFFSISLYILGISQKVQKARYQHNSLLPIQVIKKLYCKHQEQEEKEEKDKRFCRNERGRNRKNRDEAEDEAVNSDKSGKVATVKSYAINCTTGLNCCWERGSFPTLLMG